MSRFIKDYPLGQTQRSTAIAWSPDGTLLASCSSNGDIQLWDMEDERLRSVIHADCSPQPCLVWSPDSERLAACTADAKRSVKIWNVADEDLAGTIDDELTRWISCLAWSPDGEMLAAGSTDGTIRLCNVPTGKRIHTYYAHEEKISCILWSPDQDNPLLISGSVDRTIGVWDTRTWLRKRVLTGHSHEISSLAWLAQEKLIASGSYDRTVRLWDPETGQEKRILEAHTANITSIAAFHKSPLLVTRAEVIRIWSTKTWAPVGVLEESSLSNEPSVTLATHPERPFIALLRDEDSCIRIVDMQNEESPEARPVEEVTHYKSAKVVLVGESGVGKSALAHVVMGEPFQPQPSSHGRQIFPFEPSKRYPLRNGIRLETDTLLWDLAGQPSYRLIHQFHLKDVALALILFDYHDDTDPFAGVDYWLKALSQANKGDSSPMKRLLVAARTDVGGRKVSLERIEEFCAERGFDGYYETSALEGGENIAALIEAIKDTIDWDALPPITSLDLFHRIKSFLLSEQRKKSVLVSIDDLYATFQASHPDLSASLNLYDQFKEGVDLAAPSGLIHQLHFNGYVLLRPDLIDNYASALVNAVSNDPDGTGSILEIEARKGQFKLPPEMRISDRDKEEMLLLAMIEELLLNEVVLRDNGYLVFPSQSTRKHPEMPDLKEKTKTVTFTFEGAVANIYARLSVRLSRSGLFRQTEVWKDTTVYTRLAGGMYGVVLENTGEGRGRITTFFDAHSSEEMRRVFEQFVEDCLKTTASTYQSERIFTCWNCKEPLDRSLVMQRREKNLYWVYCPNCSKRVSLDDERASPPSIEKMKHEADEKLKEEIADIVAPRRYDVLFSYNESDRDEVKAIAEQLKKKGLSPWLDEEIQPGKLKQSERERQIMEIRCAAVFIGKDEAEPWSRAEREAVLGRYVSEGYPTIPVLLSNAPQGLKLPPFLNAYQRVDFRRSEPDPIDGLIWGITGKKPEGL